MAIDRAGDDTLRGGAGGDILDGGAGGDTLTDGDGNDVLRVCFQIRAASRWGGLTLWRPYMGAFPWLGPRPPRSSTPWIVGKPM